MRERGGWSTHFWQRGGRDWLPLLYNIFGIRTGKEFAETCRRSERHGYNTVFASDHLGVASPFPTLVTAALATQRLRVGTLVLNVPFWNPTLLAREVATTDVLTGGRLELGLGGGHMKWEFDELQDRHPGHDSIGVKVQRHFGRDAQA